MYNGVVDSLGVGAASRVEGELFGAASRFCAQIIEGESSVMEVLGWVSSWQSSVVILAYILLLLFTFYRYNASVIQLLQNFISVPASQNMLQSATVEFNGFLRYCKVLSFLGVGLFLAGVLHWVVGVEAELFVVICLSELIVVVVLILGRLLREVLSCFDFRSGRLSGIASLYRLDAVVFSLLLSLPIFIFLAVPIARFPLLLLVGVYYFFHVVKVFYIFSLQRFSFLQTFLYLCTVEIAPLAVIWGVVTEYNLL